ncbi:ABC transporter ATP-binding protein [Gloeocapsopsis sp. IPPAS B-1203]|uniref:ABC transporter ATP-binding protein n=1 Tax=Gloeocapsopsis sp. IPPAS B-1203 TaxID=2049454 RepID=UPI000C18CBD2|nr:ABC transporter ATP-binding protein [Gloeocapsopsis sp. IPPAS B-1203]PIG92050.1 ABC transporter [Gloeocapsopsis sp. IPPAS B-1203]
MKDINDTKSLIPLLKLYPWAIPVIIILGTLSSLAEGLGISLFIPFLQSVSHTTSQAHSQNLLVGTLNQIFGNLSFNSRLVIIPLCIFGSVLLKNCLVYGNTVLFSWLNWQISDRLRRGIYKQLLSVSFGYLERNQSGRFLSILDKETWQTSQALSVFISLITSACTIVVFVILLFLISWQLTILVAVAMLLISWSVQSVTRQVKSVGKQAARANAAFVSRALEGLSGMKVIRAFGRESYEQERFEQASQEVCTAFRRLDVISGAVNPFSEVLSTALLTGILIVALQDQSNLPTLLTFIFMLYRLQPQMKLFDSARVNLGGLTGSVEQVMELLNRADKTYIFSGKLPFKGLKQAIAFNCVTFRYDPLEKPVLQQISITIPCGKTTAIVGPSGAGKSTLIGLLCRFYDVTTGDIYVDGEPLKQLNLADWRSRIAIVSQDTYLFSSTIKENIAYGRLDATTDEIVAAAKLAHAHDFILELPQGYETKVGDRGVRLSGGQRQRLALARAIICNPEILILDEATNALDSISEHLIQEVLQSFGQNRTVIVIAHRLSTIEQADQIIVMEKGRIREKGSIQSLLQLNGLFAQLYHLQHNTVLT